MTTNCRPLTLKEQDKLKSLMLKKKITQRYIAEKNLISVTNVNHIVNGFKKITPSRIKMFNRVGINIEELMEN